MQGMSFIEVAASTERRFLLPLFNNCVAVLQDGDTLVFERLQQRQNLPPKRELKRDCSVQTLHACAVQGENAWIFVNEEEVASATKAYFAFEKELKEAVPREQRAAFKPCEVTGAVVDGKPLDPVSNRPATMSSVPVLVRAARGGVCAGRQRRGLHEAGCHAAVSACPPGGLQGARGSALL